MGLTSTTFSILLIHYQNVDLTLSCIKSLLANEARFQIIVVDHSKDEEALSFAQTKIGKNLCVIQQAKEAKHFKGKVYWHRPGMNLGYGGGMNLAFLMSNQKADLCLILNNDTLVAADFLTSMATEISPVLQNDDFGIASCIIEASPSGEVWFAGGELDLKRCMGRHVTQPKDPDKLFETDFITGCLWVFRPSLYVKMQGMREDYFLYFEDFEFCYRLKQEGYKQYITPNVTLQHFVGSTTGGDQSPTPVYFSTCNRLWFMREYRGGFAYLAFFLFFITSRSLYAAKWFFTGRWDLFWALIKGFKRGLGRKVGNLKE